MAAADSSPASAQLYDIRGARVLSICAGAFALASAGLLDGLAATTHWRHVPRLRDRFPAVDVRPDVLYVDNGQILTSAGTAAGIDLCLHLIDLCLHLIRRDHGAQVAGRMANRMVVAAHREGGQAQFVEQPVEPRRPTTRSRGRSSTPRPIWPAT